MLKFGEAFAGISGFGLGFTRAGMECRWQIENDKDCNRVLERHYPTVKRYGDITTVDPRRFEAIDVCAAGFPCQDLSVAGKRAGLAGERSGLWFEFLRVIGRTSDSGNGGVLVGQPQAECLCPCHLRLRLRLLSVKRESRRSRGFRHASCLLLL